MTSLTQDQESLISGIVHAAADIPGVRAVVLGGSHARGRAIAGSDIDLGIYYSERHPFSIPALRERIRGLAGAHDPHLTEFYEWGPWVNGGAWLTMGSQRVDLLYRSVEKCEGVLNDAGVGTYEIHFGQQPPFGFFSPTYLGELHVCRPLLDAYGEVARLKALTRDYPEALRCAVIRNCLRGVEFGLGAFAVKFAARGDVYNVAASIARFVFFLVLSLFALNRQYFLNDKTALDEISGMKDAPAGFKDRVNALLAGVGETPADLLESIGRIRALFDETRALAGALYAPSNPR